MGLLAGAGPLLKEARHVSAMEGGALRLGVVGYSFSAHWSAAQKGFPTLPFHDEIGFLEYCHQLGAGGVQITLGARPPNETARLRSRAEIFAMYIEGQVELPKQESDLARFEAELRTAKEAGAQVVRSALPGARRYEGFDSPEGFQQAASHACHSLTLAEPILRKYQVRLGLENHKDWRAEELLGTVKHVNSEWVGVCLDFGNNIALLEDPIGVTDTLAPFVFATHVKDMAVHEYEEGFLLSEVPLGEGFLDLQKMVGTVKQAAPKSQFSLEMLTRDPLQIPCLTVKYWATMEMVTGSELARMLRRVRTGDPSKLLPQVTGLSLEEQLKLEDKNVRKCLAYSRSHLGL